MTDEEQIVLDRQVALEHLMPKLLRLKDWQADKKAALKSRIALIRSHQGDHTAEVQLVLLGIKATISKLGA